MQVKPILLEKYFLRKQEVSDNEAVKRDLYFPLRHSSIDVMYVPTGPNNDRTKALKQKSILKMMQLDYTNVFASRI